MSRAGVMAILVAVLSALVLAVATTSDAPPLAARGPRLDWEMSPRALPTPTPTPPPDRSPAGDRGDSPPYLAIALIALEAALAVWIIRAIVRAWPNRPRWARRRPPPPDDFAVLDPAVVAEAVVAEAAAQRAALERGSARNAIVECWSQLEDVIVETGLTRRASDTSTELVERTLASYAVDRQAIAELAALYREARFSSHPMGEPERQAAIAALDAVHADLQSVTPRHADRAPSGQVER